MAEEWHASTYRANCEHCGGKFEACSLFCPWWLEVETNIFCAECWSRSYRQYQDMAQRMAVIARNGHRLRIVKKVGVA